MTVLHVHCKTQEECARYWHSGSVNSAITVITLLNYKQLSTEHEEI